MPSLRPLADLRPVPLVWPVVITVVGLALLWSGIDAPGQPTVVSYGAVLIAGFALAVSASVSASASVAVPVGGATATTTMTGPWLMAAALATVAASRVVVTMDDGGDFVLAPALAVAMYIVGRRGDRRQAAWTAGTVAVAGAIAVALLEDEPFIVELLAETAQFLLPAVIGDGVRSGAERVTERIETEAEARVQAERLRIARDLHDVVAHGLSTIAVQSGVAGHLLDRDPEAARASLDIINQTGKASLEELRAMVGVLRSTDDAPLSPAPAQAVAFPELLAGAEAAGLTIVDHSTGEFPPDVGDAVIVAVHRIVQEALTNVIRHAGPVPTTVTVDRGEHAATIIVRNEPAGPAHATGRLPVPSTGVGIIGMRERAESLGGTCTAGPTEGGGFLVEATIPYRVRPR